MPDDASARGRSNRRKGASGEREAAQVIRDLLGIDVRRRVRNAAGDSDLVGLDGWSLEIKSCAVDSRRSWWAQTVKQARMGDIPCLWIKVPRRGWQVLIPLGCFLGLGIDQQWAFDFEYAVTLHPEGFATVVRELSKGV